MIGGTPREEVFIGRSMRPRARGSARWVSLLVGFLVRTLLKIRSHTDSQHLPRVQARAFILIYVDHELTEK